MGNIITNIESLLEFISSLRQSDKYVEMIYLHGGCYQFHLLLKKYCDCRPLINQEKNHVVSEFEGKLFDITGEVKGEYLPMTEQDLEKASKWSFHDNMMIQISECPVCEEPILA